MMKQKPLTPTKMNTTITQVKDAARRFLDVADALNVRVSRFLDGSAEPADANAYRKVIEAEKKFIDCANEYYGESWQCCLNYELAESFINL